VAEYQRGVALEKQSDLALYNDVMENDEIPYDRWDREKKERERGKRKSRSKKEKR
jgi:hypothetical protein